MRLPKPIRLCVMATALVLGAQAGFARTEGEEGYLAEVRSAMDTMMTGMMAPASGDIDRDFVTTMRPHHQGAIAMAVAELKHGKNEQLRRIAQEIIVDQQQEIVAMNLAIGDPLPPSMAAPTQSDVPVATPMTDMPAHQHQDH